MRHNALHFRGLAWIVLFSWTGFAQAPSNSVARQDSGKWETEIAAFEASDRTNSPPQHCILFVGSSSIRLWSSLKTDFAGFPVVNRGFGGSELADSVNFAQRIIIRYQPREVLVYAGANDLAGGKDPEVVFGDFVALADKIHQHLPDTRVAFIACAPNPKRWRLSTKLRSSTPWLRVIAASINLFSLMFSLSCSAQTVSPSRTSSARTVFT